jgi:serine/threonine protein kinase
VSAAAGYPRLFGRYVLVEPVARGGMGELHLAVVAREAQKLCVIKQVLAHLEDAEYVQRFVDESNVMVQLSHGNLVPVLETGSVDGQYFLAMEYIEGRNLRELWHALEAQGQRLPLHLCLYVVKELCRGLGYAHTYRDLGLVHRDVSPPNVLLSYSGEVRLTDFGLALSAIKVQKTSPGILLGKLPYMAPEQARGEELDPRADIFSLGVILWELAAGRRMFDVEARQSVQLQRAMKPSYTPLTEVDPSLPEALETITRRALAPALEERFPDAETMRQEVAKVLATVDPTTDASSLKRFLEELYGEEIAEERQQRQRRLEQMSAEIDELVKSARRRGSSPADADEPPADALAETNEIPTADLQPGTTLDDKYLIHAMIGQGGMGKVYRATHLGIDKVVALKIMLPEYGQIESVVERFQMEARAANRIGHPNIVEIYDSGTTKGGLLYYAMEYLEGTDLADLLAAERKLEINQALRIAVQVCEAMADAHEAGVIHRDLKPENVYLVVRENAPDFVKLVDFGIARLEGARRKTLPGLAIGTPEYMAPEQADAKPYDHRVDIYAVGVMLFEMLAGQVPHPGSSHGEVVMHKVSGTRVSLREERPDVPEELVGLIHRLLATDPDERPAAMAKLAYELRRLLEGRAAAVASVLNISGPKRAITGGGQEFSEGEEPGFDESFGMTAQLKAFERGGKTRALRLLALTMGGVALMLGVVAAVLLLAKQPEETATVPTIVINAPDIGPRGRPDAGVVSSKVPARPRVYRPRRRPRKTAPPERLEGTLDPFAKNKKKRRGR